MRKAGDRLRALALAVTAVAAGAAAWLAGCTNDVFDPGSLQNLPPVARVFIGPAEGGELNPTSYYNRTFHWNGSDADGFVVEYYVSIRTARDVPAAWDTTTATDTTMTFTTDDTGHAEALIMVACLDNRGALSDTVEQYVPLKNFPPVVNFQADFDTLRWSFGAASFRFFALDLDGNETMSDTLRYKLDTADTNIVRIYGEEGADPALCWVKRRFGDFEAGTFEIELHGIPPSPARTLTVAVTDEAAADARFEWTWEVRPALSPVLLVADAGPFTDGLYSALMDEMFGAGSWSRYEMKDGLPDRLWALKETFREFEVVLWYTGGSASLSLKAATQPLVDYLYGGPEEAPRGKLLLVAPSAVGSGTNLPFAFIRTVLGLSPTAAPANSFFQQAGPQALGRQAWLPSFTAERDRFAATLGVQPLEGSEVLYQMEWCRTCYCGTPPCREPWDPVICTRRPVRSPEEPLAHVVVLTTQMEYYYRTQAVAALRGLLEDELGVEP